MCIRDREGEPNGWNDGEGRDGAGGLVGAPPRSWRRQVRPPPQRYSAKRKLRVVSRLLRGEPLELLARELNVTAARLSEWRDRALLAAEAALEETELLREKIARLEAGAPFRCTAPRL